MINNKSKKNEDDYSSSDEDNSVDATKVMKAQNHKLRKNGRYTLPQQLMVLLSQEEIDSRLLVG